MPLIKPRLSSFIERRNRKRVIASIDSVQLQVAMSNALIARNWNKAQKLSREMTAKVFSDLIVLKGQYQMAVIAEKFDSEACERMVQTGDKMISLLKDVEVRKKLRKIDKLKHFQRAANEMQSAGEGKRQDRLRFMSISQHMQYLVATGYTGFWGSFHATFNQRLIEFVPKSHSSAEIRNIVKSVRKEQLSISKNISKLYSVTRRGSRDDMLQVSSDLLQLQRVTVHRISNLCASICSRTRAVLRDDLEGDPTKLGQVDLLAGKLARSWILLVVFALYVIFLTLLPPQDPTFREVVKTVRKLRFRSKRKKPKVVSPETLIETGPKFNGKYIQLNGFVKNLTTKRTRDGKFLTVFEVYEARSERAVKVAVIFEHIGHRGLVNTSYVEVIGTWKETSPLADTPILQLERLKISELKKISGLEYILDKIRPWFDYFPNSYHAFWSIRPQLNREGSGPKAILTGAGELIVIEPFHQQREDI